MCHVDVETSLECGRALLWMRTTTTSNSWQPTAMCEDMRMNRETQTHSAQSTHEGGEFGHSGKVFVFVSCGGTRSSSRRLVLLCDFFLHVQQGGFAHTLIMVSNSPRADALRSNVCVPTCWRDCWTRVRMIVVGGRRGACRRYVVCFSHCSRRW